MLIEAIKTCRDIYINHDKTPTHVYMHPDTARKLKDELKDMLGKKCPIGVNRIWGLRIKHDNDIEVGCTKYICE